MAFKSASSPGSYNQLVGPVDRTSKVLAKNERDRNRQIEHNKKLADTHRAYAKSFDFGIQIEGQSRQNALAFEDYFRGIDQKFQMKAIEDAHQSAITAADQKVAQVNRDTDQLVNLVHKTLDTGVDIYKRVEAKKEIQRNNDAASLSSQFPSTVKMFEGKKIGLAFLDGQMTRDELKQEALRLGSSPESILAAASASDGVFTLAAMNNVSNDINNLPYMIPVDTNPIPGLNGKTGAEIQTVAEANVAFQQKLQGMMRLHKAETGQELNLSTFQKVIDKAQSRYIADISRVQRTQASAQLQDQQQNSFFHTLRGPILENNPKAQADWLVKRQTETPGNRYSDIQHLIAGAGITGSGVTPDLLNEFAGRPVLNKDGQPVNGKTYGDMYLTEIDEARDKLRSEQVSDLQNYGIKQKAILQSTLNAVNGVTKSGVKLNPADVQAIVQEYKDDGGNAAGLEVLMANLNMHTMSDGPGVEAAESWWSGMVADDQYLQNVRVGQILKVAPNPEWANNKLKELRIAHRANPLTKDRETYIRNDLAKRLDVHGPDAYKDTSFIPAFREIDTQWQEWEREAGGGAEGFKYAEAKFKQVYGEANDKTKQFTGPLAVFNAKDNPGKTGFVRYQADASLAGDVGLFRDWSNALSAASGGSTRVSDRLNSLDKIDLSALPAADVERFLKDFHNRKIMPNDPTMDRLRTLGDAITGTKGGNLNVFETAEALADVYNIDLKQFEPQVGAGNVIIDMQNQLQMKYGGSVAAHYTGVPSGEATWSRYTVQPGDGKAITNGANDLGVDPKSFAALLHKESGLNPNIWGGAGGNYRGLIQFGAGARSETGLPNQDMTIPEQMPYVIKYLRGRGYGTKGTQVPGDHAGNIQRIYATILVGNPWGNIDAADSNGTTVRNSMKGFLPGGNHYTAASKVLGFGSSIRGQTEPTVVPTTQTPEKDDGFGYTITTGKKGSSPKSGTAPVLVDRIGKGEDGVEYVIVREGNKESPMPLEEYLAQGGKL